MKKGLIALMLCCLMFALVTSCYAGEYLDQLTYKLSRGSANVVSCVGEIGKGMSEGVEDSENKVFGGLVGICTIISKFQDADSELMEVYENDSGVFYRLNPQRTTLIKKIISHTKTTNSRAPSTSSAKQFQRFKDLMKTTRKSSDDLDSDLKQFL